MPVAEETASQSGAASKGALRSAVRAERAQRSADAIADTERTVTARLLALVAQRDARTVACYLSRPAEPPTRAFIAAALARDIRVLLPVTRDDDTLDWVRVQTGWRERVGRLGIGEPEGTLLGASALADADLVIVPAAMASRRGERLGWGRGFYDRALAAIAGSGYTYALVFDSEFTDSLPTEAHDQAMDGVVTPSGTYEIPAEPAGHRAPRD